MLANFKTALAARGMKQVDLAYELRIPASTLSEIVKQRRLPTASARKGIAAALGADEDWLFSRLIQIPEPKSHKDEEEVS